MQATARRLSVLSATSCARRRLIRDVRPTKNSKTMDTAVALITLAVVIGAIYLAFAYPAVSIPLVISCIAIWNYRRQKANTPPHTLPTISRLYTENAKRYRRFGKGLTDAQRAQLRFDGLPGFLPLKDVIRVSNVSIDGKVGGTECRGCLAWNNMFAYEQGVSFQLPPELRDLAPKINRGDRLFIEGTASFSPALDSDSTSYYTIHSITSAHL